MNARSSKLSGKNTPKQQRPSTGLSSTCAQVTATGAGSGPAARDWYDEALTATWEHEERDRRGRVCVCVSRAKP